MRGGEEVKISKRAGSYVTVRDLIDWVGRDAVRFFLVSRKADSEFVFDVDLARAEERGEPGVLRAVRARTGVQRVRPGGQATLEDAATLDQLANAKELQLAQRLGGVSRSAGRGGAGARAALGRLLPARARGRFPQLL